MTPFRNKTLLLFTLFLTLVPLFAFAEKSYFLPKGLSFSPKEGDGYAIRDFRPIGWSADGKFAYVETLQDKRHNIFFVTYHIVDAITDEHILEFKDTESFKSASVDTMAEASWETYAPAFRGHLAKAGIRQRPYTFLPSFPLIANGKTYRGSAEWAPARDGGGYSVFVEEAPGAARKLIGAGRDGTLAEVRINRYLPSPYENRIAVLVEIETVTKEIYYILMGCHLTVGF